MKAACLGVSLTMASWGGAAKHSDAATVIDYQLSGYINPYPIGMEDNALTNVYVFYSLNSSGSASSIYDHYVGDVGTSSYHPFSFTIGDDPSWYDSDTYTIMGLYDLDNDATPDGVTVGLNPSDASDAIANNLEWWDLFPYTNETDVMDWLSNGQTDDLTNFFATNFPDYLGEFSGRNITLVNFSSAVEGGEAYAEISPVPLPPALALFASGLGLAALIRRKKE